MIRFFALSIVVIPGFLAVFGFKLMRDTVFGVLNSQISSLVLQFIIGLLLFILGLSFVAGFIFYRDKKRKKIQPKFQKKSR